MSVEPVGPVPPLDEVVAEVWPGIPVVGNVRGVEDGEFVDVVGEDVVRAGTSEAMKLS